MFLLPGVILFPLTYLVLYQGDFTIFAIAIFFCGLVTVAQFSYVSEYLPKVFPVHLRGTGSGFATNIGGRMLGTMAAIVNTELLAPLFTGDGEPAEGGDRGRDHRRRRSTPSRWCCRSCCRRRSRRERSREVITSS